MALIIHQAPPFMALTSLYLILVFLLSALIITTSHNPKNHDLRSVHFTLYAHDIFNKTDFNILKGIAGPALTAKTAPLGSIFGIKDSLTTTSNPSSDRLGTIEMLLFTHTSDGGSAIGINKITLNLKSGQKGSISLAGVTAYIGPGDIPVAGGTGDFLFVQAVPYKFSWVREISQLYTWTFVLNMQRSILSSLMRQQTQWFQPGSCPVPSSSSMFASPVPSQFSKAVNPVPNGPRNVRELFSGVPSILDVPNISSCPVPSDYCAVPVKSSKAASPVPHDARIIVDFRNLLKWTQNHNWNNLINLSMIIDKGVSSSCPVPSSSSSVVSSVPQLVSSVPQQSSSVNSPVPHIAKCITVV